jgi:ribose transport system substrate-binding protein
VKRLPPALAGENGWTEVEGCPLYTNDDFPSPAAAEDILNKYPDLGAFIPTAVRSVPAGRQQGDDGATQGEAAGRVARRAVADTLPMQIDALREGYGR